MSIIDTVKYYFDIMNKRIFSNDFSLALVSFLHQTKVNVLNIAAEFDLTIAQAFSLLLMDTSNAHSMKSYSQTYSFDAGNLTGIIDGLEEKGLVVREQDPKDRRIKTLRVLPKGIELQKKLLSRMSDENNELFSPLSSQEKVQFSSCILKICEAMESKCPLRRQV